MIPADRSGKSISWVKLSNSEESLKIIVPNYNGSVISGLSSLLGMVTSYDMIVNVMGNCGSKPCAIAQVKEQRVDDNYGSPVELLRCTLMASETCYQTENPSNQNMSQNTSVPKNVTLSNQSRSTERPNLKIDPWFISGFVDAEVYFSRVALEFSKDSKAKFKYTPRLIFGINLHVKDLSILLSIKETLGVGTVSTRGKVTNYTVKAFKDIEVIVNHFKLYPLVRIATSKYLVYEYWLQAYNIMAKKEHFNYQGIIKLVTLKSLTNYGLSDSLKEAFHPVGTDINISLIDKKYYNFRSIPHEMWVAGFTSGDGSFYTKLTPYKDTFHTGCIFKITLHIKDTALSPNGLEGLYAYFSNYFQLPSLSSDTLKEGGSSFHKYKFRDSKGIGFSKQTVTLTISNIKDIVAYALI
jgi:hypothetical protein